MREEPVLTDEDHRRWAMWMHVAAAWGRTPTHRRRVERSRQAIASMHRDYPDAYLAWSAGKDSTVMVHLACVGMDLGLRAMNISDDLDYPGERAYLARLSEAWAVTVDYVELGYSLYDWMLAHRGEWSAADELHGRGGRMADMAFYDQIEAYSSGRGSPGVYLGLRAVESRGRLMNRRMRGLQYTKKSGETVCQPLADWEDIDVYAYCAANSVPLFAVYRCVRLHDEPGRVRVSWWIVGTSALTGSAVWLRAYYPSLYRRLCALFPDGGAYA